VHGKAQRHKSRASLAGRVSEKEVAALPIGKQEIGSIPCARQILLLGILVVLFVAGASAQVPDNFPDVTAISLEDLMNLNVTSVSKRTQKLADAAAAIFVITQEDIRRSGATSVSEAFGMVPGLAVA